MANSIGLSIYIGRVRRKREKDQLILDKFDGSTDFFEVLKTAIRSNFSQYLDVGDQRRRLQANNDLYIQGRSLDGTIDVGEYGISSILRAANGSTSFRREREHAEMLPLYYRAWCPEDRNFACFALQSFGHHGCKTAIERLIVQTFKERFPEYHFEMREALSKAQIAHYVSNGAVKEFIFTHHGVPSDWASGYGGDALEATEGEIEVSIKAKRGKSIPWPLRLSEYFNGQAIDPRGLFELKSFETDTFKVRLEVDGRMRTLSHAELVRFSSRRDFTNDVKTTPQGHPLREDIRAIAIRLLDETGAEL